MQRLVAHFPSALPGFGLLTLRLVLSGSLLVDGSRARGMTTVWPDADVEVSVAAALLFIACATFVALGLLTPVTQLIVVVIEIAILSGVWWAKGVTIMYGPWPTRLYQTAMAVSLALTGPGAYSLDAKLFGRREIIIPPRPRSRRS